jgi:hypothetical protein
VTAGAQLLDHGARDAGKRDQRRVGYGTDARRDHIGADAVERDEAEVEKPRVADHDVQPDGQQDGGRGELLQGALLPGDHGQDQQEDDRQRGQQDVQRDGRQRQEVSRIAQAFPWHVLSAHDTTPLRRSVLRCIVTRCISYGIVRRFGTLVKTS